MRRRDQGQRPLGRRPRRAGRGERVGTSSPAASAPCRANQARAGLLTFGDAVAEIARATGRDILYGPLTTQAYADEQRAQGVPEEWVQVSSGAYEHVRSGRLASVTEDVRRVLGRPARDFSAYARTAAAQGAWEI